MTNNPEIRLGGTSITYEGRAFVFRDVHSPEPLLNIEDADVADLILFLYRYSKRAQGQVRVEAVTE